MFFFDCTRSHHPPGQRRIKRTFSNRRDRETYITRHDAKYHDAMLAARLGIEYGPTLGEAVGDFLAHMQKLFRDGKRDKKTMKYYRGICAKLVAHFGSRAPLDSIGRRAMLTFAAAEKKNGSQSNGDRFVKAAKVVKRIQKFAEVMVSWEIPTADISPSHRTRESIPIEDIRDFLRAMPEDSVERVFAMTKFVTMMRNEELYAADVGDVTENDDGSGELAYTLRNKQTGEKIAHVTHLPAVLMAALRPWLDRDPSEPLFYLDPVDAWGRAYRNQKRRRIGEHSLRKRFVSASARASVRREQSSSSPGKVDITSIGQFRHEGATIAMEELESAYAVTEHLHHADERTTRKHYKLGKKAAALAQSRKVTEAVAGKL